MDITQAVNETVAEDEHLQIQLKRIRHEFDVFLSMLNIRLQKKNQYCNAYTMTVTADPLQVASSFRLQ